MDLTKLRSQLVAHEGLRKFPYEDSVGKLTIGIGRNLKDVGLSSDEITYLFNNDVNGVILNLTSKLPWFNKLDEVRQRALTDMAFNVGLSGLLKSPKMLDALSKGQWLVAHDEALNGPWSHQVGQRAQDIALQFLTGHD